MFDEARSLLTTDKTRAFLDNWQALVSAADGIPDWRAVDPALISAILPDVWLYERLEDGGDFLCRLAGDEIIRKWGRKIMHRRFTEFADPVAGSRMMQNLNATIVRRGLGVGLTSKSQDTSWFAERIYGPVRRGDAWCVFGCTAYVVRHPMEALQADTPVSRFFLFDAVDGTPICEDSH